MLPKFLIADNSQETIDQVYVVHTQEPKFIMQFDLDDADTDQVVYWLDEEPTDENLIEELIDDATEFLEKELENQERIFDDGGFEDE